MSEWGPFDCRECGMHVDPDKPDPCFGLLPGVMFACCGHGGKHPERGSVTAYVSFDNGTALYFPSAVWSVVPLCDASDETGSYIRALTDVRDEMS